MAKKAHSLILLGYNPAYLVNNLVNNKITRLAVGVFGFDSPVSKATFMGRFGIHPYRFEAGASVIDIMSEFDLHKSPESGIGLPIGTVNKAGGELKIREATHLEKGVMARVNRMLSRANEFTLAPISRNIESLESAAAYYYGLKKLWPGMWGSMFNPIPPDIARSLANIDPLPICAGDEYTAISAPART